MSQSLSQVYVHIIYSTKNRIPIITNELRPKLHAYIVGTMSKLGSYVLEIYANPDHIHILSTLPKTRSLADLIQKSKTPSSKWVKNTYPALPNFSWQLGYAGFSVGASSLEAVKRYIRNQPVHHKKESFQDELRRFLNAYHVDYDERYVWD